MYVTITYYYYVGMLKCSLTLFRLLIVRDSGLSDSTSMFGDSMAWYHVVMELQVIRRLVYQAGPFLAQQPLMSEKGSSLIAKKA